MGPLAHTWKGIIKIKKKHPDSSAYENNCEAKEGYFISVCPVDPGLRPCLILFGIVSTAFLASTVNICGAGTL